MALSDEGKNGDPLTPTEASKQHHGLDVLDRVIPRWKSEGLLDSLGRLYRLVSVVHRIMNCLAS